MLRFQPCPGHRAFPFSKTGAFSENTTRWALMRLWKRSWPLWLLWIFVPGAGTPTQCLPHSPGSPPPKQPSKPSPWTKYIKKWVCRTRFLENGSVWMMLTFSAGEVWVLMKQNKTNRSSIAWDTRLSRFQGGRILLAWWLKAILILLWKLLFFLMFILVWQ